MGKGIATGIFRLARLGAFLVFTAATITACGNGAAPASNTPIEIAANTPAKVSLTASPEPTETGEPTPTPGRSPTATSTPATLATTSHYSLPEWMKEPQTDILMEWIRKTGDGPSGGTLSFLNPETGQWADLPFPADASYYFWFDNMHFGFLPKNLASMSLFDLETGQGSTQPVPEDSIQFIEVNEYAPQALVVKRRTNSPEKYFFDYVDQPNSRTTSRSGRYSAETNWDVAGNPIKITDNTTGEVVLESDLSDGLWESEYAWSPWQNRYIAFVRGSPDGETSSLITRNTVLKVIDVKNGDLVAEFKGDIGNIQWSPDGSRILYQSVWARYATMGIPVKGAPCIFDIVSLKNRCIRKIPEAPAPAGYQLETTGLYSWSPDGQSLRYLALYVQPESSKHIGEICTYDLAKGLVACPMEQLVEPQGWGISYYDYSPDGQFINFCFSESNILDSFIGSGYDALVKADGTGLLTWIGLGEKGEPQCSYFRQVWRPSP